MVGLLCPGLCPSCAIAKILTSATAMPETGLGPCWQCSRGMPQSPLSQTETQVTSGFLWPLVCRLDHTSNSDTTGNQWSLVPSGILLRRRIQILRINNMQSIERGSPLYISLTNNDLIAMEYSRLWRMSLENYYEINCVRALIAREPKHVTFAEQHVDVLYEWRKFTES